MIFLGPDFHGISELFEGCCCYTYTVYQYMKLAIRFLRERMMSRRLLANHSKFDGNGQSLPLIQKGHLYSSTDLKWARGNGQESKDKPEHICCHHILSFILDIWTVYFLQTKIAVFFFPPKTRCCDLRVDLPRRHAVCGHQVDGGLRGPAGWRGLIFVWRFLFGKKNPKKLWLFGE